MSYAYQQSLATYDNLISAYKKAKQNTLSKDQLDNINRQVKEQTQQALGLGAGLPISMTVATSFLKTKGSKALLKGLGKKLGMNDEDIETLLTKNPKDAMAHLVEKYGNRKINKLLGRKPPAETEADVADVAEEPIDTEAFNVEFPSLAEGGLRMTNRMGDLLETPMQQRPPVDTDEFFDASEDLGGDLMETSFPIVSSEAVSVPSVEGTAMRTITSEGDTTAGETATAVATAGEVGEDVAITGEALDATPLAPLGVILGLAGMLASFIPFMSHHHRSPPPKLTPNLSRPSFQAGI